MSNYFPVDVLRPNGDCANNQCRARQAEHLAKSGPWAPTVWRPAYDDADAPVVHADNEWGIEVEGEPVTASVAEVSPAAPPVPPAVGASAGASAGAGAGAGAASGAASATSAPVQVPAAGLVFSRPVEAVAEVAAEDKVKVEGKSLEDLMNEMRGLTKR